LYLVEGYWSIAAAVCESIAAAVFVDCGWDLKEFWLIFRGILEPIAMLEDLKQQPQPVTVLYELCQKQGKQVEIKYRKKDSKNTASVFVDGEFVACGYSCQKDSAKIDAAKEAVLKLTETEDGKEMMKGIIASTYSSQKDLQKNDEKEAVNKMTETADDKNLLNGIPLVLNQVGEIEVAKQKLNQFCEKKRLAKPTYRMTREQWTFYMENIIAGSLVFQNVSREMLMLETTRASPDCRCYFFFCLPSSTFGITKKHASRTIFTPPKWSILCVS